MENIHKYYWVLNKRLGTLIKTWIYFSKRHGKVGGTIISTSKKFILIADVFNNCFKNCIKKSILWIYLHHTDRAMIHTICKERSPTADLLSQLCYIVMSVDSLLRSKSLTVLQFYSWVHNVYKRLPQPLFASTDNRREKASSTSMNSKGLA